MSSIPSSLDFKFHGPSVFTLPIGKRRDFLHCMSFMKATKISYAPQALWLNMQFQYFSSPRLIPYEKSTSPLRSVITLPMLICHLCPRANEECKLGEQALEQEV